MAGNESKHNSTARAEHQNRAERSANAVISIRILSFRLFSIANAQVLTGLRRFQQPLTE